MILEYHRPDKVEDALKLLGRENPKTVPLGGGTVLNTPSEEEVAVVDLQKLGLSEISQKGSQLTIGATATLQALLDTEGIQPALAKVIQHEATYNLRQAGTVAGSLVSAGGRSPLLAALMALDAQLTWLPGDVSQPLGEFVPVRAGGGIGAIIAAVSISLQTKLAYEYVARTPADKPVVLAAAGRWPSGRTRIVLGGYGKAPLTVMDGEANEGVLEGVADAYLTAEDQWATAEYRSQTARTLARRCLEALEAAQ